MQKDSITKKEIAMLKQVLRSLAENLHSLRLQQAFLTGLKTLSIIDAKRQAAKLLKLAFKFQANLRMDPSFVQLLKELKS